MDEPPRERSGERRLCTLSSIDLGCLAQAARAFVGVRTRFSDPLGLEEGQKCLGVCVSRTGQVKSCGRHILLNYGVTVVALSGLGIQVAFTLS